MEAILFPIWLPALLLLVGIVLLVTAEGVGWKILGWVLVFLGGLPLALLIWVNFRHFRH